MIIDRDDVRHLPFVFKNVEVDDGLLDIEFVHRVSNPVIKAIEIEPLD